MEIEQINLKKKIMPVLLKDLVIPQSTNSERVVQNFEVQAVEL